MQTDTLQRFHDVDDDEPALSRALASSLQTPPAHVTMDDEEATNLALALSISLEGVANEAATTRQDEDDAALQAALRASEEESKQLEDVCRALDAMLLVEQQPATTSHMAEGPAEDQAMVRDHHHRGLAEVDPFPPPRQTADSALPQCMPPSLQPQTSNEVRAVILRIEEEEQAARRSQELGPDAFACVLCLEDEVPQLAGHTLSCGHVFCVQCIGAHVRVKIDAHDVSGEALACPSCVAPIRVSDVHAPRGGDDASWQKYASRLTRR